LGDGSGRKNFERNAGGSVYISADHEVSIRRRRQTGERFFNINGTASPSVPSTFARRSLTAGHFFYPRLFTQARERPGVWVKNGDHGQRIAIVIKESAGD
jgi:hypothetical protein